MSSVFLVPEGRQSSGYVGALLDLADSDRQVVYLEAEVRRARRREWAMGLSAVAGWAMVVVTNWRYLCQLGEALVGMAGRVIGGLF